MGAERAGVSAAAVYDSEPPMKNPAPATPAPAEGGEREYCRFGKRDLDKMSWLAPVLNNRFGDLLNLELRHQHLFFIRGDEVVDNVGYSEKGVRFNEGDFGKPIRTMHDLRTAGYWLIGRPYDPEVMREALRRQQDGYYYSVFSNQCQDWADRLKKTAERVEREWGLKPGEMLKGLPPAERRQLTDVQRVPPTEPASVGMGLVAVLLGVGAILAPILFADRFALLLGGVFAASGVSHAVYAFRGKDVRAAVPILFTAAVYLLGGAFMLANTQFAVMAASAIIALTLGVQGASQILMAVFSRPLKNWLATLAAGLGMAACAAMVYARWPLSGQRFLGNLVGISLIVGGLSTIYLSQRTRNETG